LNVLLFIAKLRARQLVCSVYFVKPVNRVRCFESQSGCDCEANILLHYSGNRTAVLNTSLRVVVPNEALVCGTKGYIKVIACYVITYLSSVNARTRWFLLQTDFVLHRYVLRCIVQRNWNFTWKALILRFTSSTFRRNLQRARLIFATVSVSTTKPLKFGDAYSKASDLCVHGVSLFEHL